MAENEEMSGARLRALADEDVPNLSYQERYQHIADLLGIRLSELFKRQMEQAAEASVVLEAT